MSTFSPISSPSMRPGGYVSSPSMRPGGYVSSPAYNQQPVSYAPMQQTYTQPQVREVRLLIRSCVMLRRST